MSGIWGDRRSARTLLGLTAALCIGFGATGAAAFSSPFEVVRGLNPTSRDPGPAFCQSSSLSQRLVCLDMRVDTGTLSFYQPLQGQQSPYDPDPGGMLPSEAVFSSILNFDAGTISISNFILPDDFPSGGFQTAFEHENVPDSLSGTMTPVAGELLADGLARFWQIDIAIAYGFNYPLPGSQNNRGMLSGVLSTGDVAIPLSGCDAPDRGVALPTAHLDRSTGVAQLAFAACPQSGDIFLGSTDTGSDFVEHNAYRLRLVGRFTAVPEPNTMLLASLGLLGIAWAGRRPR